MATGESGEQRVVVVTGATGGIGRCAVAGLIARGVRVLAVDLDAEPRDHREDLDPERLVYHRADVSDEDQVSSIVKAVSARWGRLDGLLNNAGVIGPLTEIDDYSAESFDRVLRTNVRGTWLCMKQALPALTASRGVIVNVASGAGLQGSARMSGYVASKHAVVGLTKALAVESARDGVRVNAMCPGAVDTPMLTDVERAVSPDAPELARGLIGQNYPVGRIAEPAEIASMAIWLLLDAPSYLTGAIIPIDGGRAAGSAGRVDVEASDGG
jgi:NAD(P)-dependent dehydrogenase (short-subunit alcohol dehydrogenase family)